MRFLLPCLALVFGAASQSTRVLFTDDFESGLDRWEVIGAQYVRTEDSNDSAHGRVLVLEPGGDVLALIRGSESWGPVRLEASVRFPTDEDNYLGAAYNYTRRGARSDFGLIYIKGNDSYLQANPHRDFNVSRTLYPEHRVTLRDAAAIATGHWQRFAIEVIAGECHFYVGDMTTPQMTFDTPDMTKGQVGVQPRSVGDPVWIDDVLVTALPKFSYSGPPRPARSDRSDRLSAWEAIGPLEATDDAVARDPAAASGQWRRLETDWRGAVVTGAIVDYHGPRTVAYFRTRVPSDRARAAVFHVSSVDDLAVWINGRFHWFIARRDFAWFDFATNPAHAGTRIPIDLAAGSNEIVVRVRGGVYASGGFYARVE